MVERFQVLQSDADARFTPRDFYAVLQWLPAGCPLVGGQAVAWWAERYEIRARDQGRERVVTSQDIDFWGGREDLVQLATRMKRRPVFPHEYEMTVWVGAVPLEINGKRTVAEFLHTIPGLDTNKPEVACVGQEIEIGGKRRLLQVLTPVSLVLAKVHALRHFDQKQRQDKFHLTVCLEASRHFLVELLEARKIRLALWNVKRLVECHQTKATRRLERRHEFQTLGAVPLDRFRRESTNRAQGEEDRARLANFCSDFWPRAAARQRGLR